jgi:hypothetical protein
MNDMTANVFRLTPGEDLKQRIEELVTEKQIQAGWIGTCICSLTRYLLRFANAAAITSGAGYFEIVCVAGIVSCNGVHLHMVISDGSGKTIGDHLCDGCIIYTLQKLSSLAAINMFLQG